jgi:hypothetical protein
MRSFSGAALGIVIGALSVNVSSSLAPSGEVIRACVHSRTQSVRIISPAQSCTSSETLMQWNVQGPTGPVGPSGTTGLQGPQGPAGLAGPEGIPGLSAPMLVVVDSAGNAVGPFVQDESGDGAIIHAGPGEVPAKVDVLSNHLLGANAVFFSSTDCTGTPYVLAPDLRLLPWAGGDGVSIYYPSGALTVLTTLSFRRNDGTGCALTFPSSRSVLPVIPFNTSAFVPPFRVVLR